MEIEDLAGKPKDFKPKGKYVVRTPTDQQRVRLEKLMENPTKPVPIPMSKQQKDLLAAVPTFVRNVMGSSAGAGSGEFHVYRHLRRKEFARQKQIQNKSRQEELDEEFQQKIEDNRNLFESKTAKKRAKRQKKKQQRKNRPARAATAGNDDDKDEDDDDEEGDDSDEDGPSTAEKRRKSTDDDDADAAGDAVVAAGESNETAVADDDDSSKTKADDANPEEQPSEPTASDVADADAEEPVIATVAPKCSAATETSSASSDPVD